jgi:hypothetical protein
MSPVTALQSALIASELVPENRHKVDEYDADSYEPSGRKSLSS